MLPLIVALISLRWTFKETCKQPCRFRDSALTEIHKHSKFRFGIACTYVTLKLHQLRGHVPSAQGASIEPVE